MKKCILIIFLLFFTACDDKDETFDDADRTYFRYNEKDNYYYCLPWNHNKNQNRYRKYPLVIFLHGSGGAGNISYLDYLGYQNPESSTVNETAKSFQTNHPSYVLIPQTDGYWDNTILIELVKSFKKKYRINKKRIYLIGYSMGGSGSYSFANSYYDDSGHLFAGIIRLAGQSQVSVRDKIAEKTSIWLHIGLNDTQTRIDVTRQAYEFLKNYHSDVTENSEEITISGYSGTTLTLKINGKKRFKKTEYNDVGHGIVTLPFRDPDVIKWLYKQEL